MARHRRAHRRVALVPLSPPCRPCRLPSSSWLVGRARLRVALRASRLRVDHGPRRRGGRATAWRPLPPLRALADRAGVRFGSAVMVRDMRADPRYSPLLVREFNSVTPFVEMKWGTIHELDRRLRRDRYGGLRRDADVLLAGRWCADRQLPRCGLQDRPSDWVRWVPTIPEGPSHAAGFSAYQEASGSLFLDKLEMVWFVPCFEFRFPTPEWHCVITWEAIVSVLFGYERDADWGHVSFEPCTNDGNAGAYPSFERLIWSTSVEEIHESLPAEVHKGLRFPVSGVLAAQAGESPSEYIGLGIPLMVTDGSIGISRCNWAKRATINDPLYMQGLLEVLWDTGSSDPWKRYRHGIKYRMDELK